MASEDAPPPPPAAAAETPVAPDTPQKSETAPANEISSTPAVPTASEKSAGPAGSPVSESAGLEKATAETANSAQEKTSTSVPASKPAPAPAPTPSKVQQTGTQLWREKAGSIFGQSSSRLAEVATKASTAVAGAAEVTGSRVKATWENTKESWQANVQPRMHATWQSTRESWQTNVQPRMDAAARAAAETGAKIKLGLIQTREKVTSAAVQKRAAEATRKSLERSRSFLVKMEILPPELNPRAVFGVPLEKVVGYQNSSLPVPHIVIACTEFIREEGMLSEYLFDDDGDPMMITRLMKIYERDDQSNIPPGYMARDVAQLLLAFFRCLPEPVLTYKLYEDIVAIGGGDALRLQELLATLPAANLATLERLLMVLAEIAKEAELTKMDAESLAVEWAPVLLWKKAVAPTITSMPAVASGARTGSLASPHQDPIDGSPLPPEASAAMDSDSQAASIIEGSRSSSSDAADSEAEDLKDYKAIVQAIKCMIEQYDVVFKETQNDEAGNE